MPPSSLEYLQNRFKEAYDDTASRAVKRAREVKARKAFAYSLKAIAVFGGIAVAAGLSGFWSHVVGILIAVVVALDQIAANHRRLLVVTKADQAYSRLLDSVAHKYNQDLGPILRLRETEPQKAESDLESLIAASNETLFNERQKIETALQEEDLKLLNSLSMEGTKVPATH